ncbi:MAG: GAF domain-containing protein [Thermodesulfobacteriota bacterium]
MENSLQVQQRTIELVTELLAEEYDSLGPQEKIFNDISGLFKGFWTEYQACQVGYHTFQHALDVTLAAIRMAAGWNALHPNDCISPENIEALLYSGLFHDSGYIKDKDDNDGLGGKYTFDHTDRSKKVARSYLTRKNKDPELIDLVDLIIEVTDFGGKPDLSVFSSAEQGIVARMVASADLIAQMADIDYMSRLHDLHNEFLEAYDFIGREKLQEQGIHTYESFEDILNETVSFYENIILPRLEYLGRMDQYLIAFFGEGRNPYLENIIANLSAQMQAGQVKWQRLGEILQELGLVSQEVIQEALLRQQDHNSGAPTIRHATGDQLRERLFQWADATNKSKQLGDVLMEMNAVEPSTLRHGILAQLMPPKLLSKLSRNELIFLLNTSLLVQNSQNDPWVFNQILEMINEQMDCKSCSLFLADRDAHSLILALQAGTSTRELKQKFEIDKGLIGWVYSHGRTAYLAKGMLVDQFAVEQAAPISEEVGSLLTIPVYISGELVGVMELAEKTTGAFSSRDADIMTVVTNILASLLLVISQGMALSQPGGDGANKGK